MDEPMPHHDKLLELFRSSDERNVAIAMEMAKNPEYAFLQSKIDDYLFLYQCLINEKVRVIEPQHIIELNDTRMLKTERQKSSLPPEIRELKHLKWLEITSCELKKLPPEIGELQNLEYLDLRHNKLTKLPKEVGQLQQLRFLGLAQNQLKRLPNTIGQLQNLVRLEVSSNPLGRLPKQIGQLISLDGLVLDDVRLKKIPKSMKALSNLSRLYILKSGLSDKWITKLEQWLPECKIRYENVDVFGVQPENLPLPKPKFDK